jgi:hypothetical protein
VSSILSILFFHEFARANELEEEERNSSTSFSIQPSLLQRIPDDDKEAYWLESLPEGKPSLSA